MIFQKLIQNSASLDSPSGLIDRSLCLHLTFQVHTRRESTADGDHRHSTEMVKDLVPIHRDPPGRSWSEPFGPLPPEVNTSVTVPLEAGAAGNPAVLYWVYFHPLPSLSFCPLPLRVWPQCPCVWAFPHGEYRHCGKRPSRRQVAWWPVLHSASAWWSPGILFRRQPCGSLKGTPKSHIHDTEVGSNFQTWEIIAL